MRDVPAGRKMPSVSIIDVKATPKPKGPPMDPNESQEPETSFTCPDCGAKLVVESAKDEESEDLGGGMGDEGKY